VVDFSRKKMVYILPETNITPENRQSQKERIIFQPSIFRAFAGSFREGNLK